MAKVSEVTGGQERKKEVGEREMSLGLSAEEKKKY